MQSGGEFVGVEKLVLFPDHDGERRLRVMDVGGVVARPKRPHQQPGIMADQDVASRRIDGEEERRQMIERVDADAVQQEERQNARHERRRAYFGSRL